MTELLIVTETCRSCGSTHELEEAARSTKDVGTIDCPTCGAVLKSWEGHVRYELLRPWTGPRRLPGRPGGRPRKLP